MEDATLYQRYQEARSLLEQVLSTKSHDELLSVTQHYLQAHCKRCGAMLKEPAAHARTPLCTACQSLMRSAKEGAQGEAQMSAIAPYEEKSGETCDVMVKRWPEHLQAIVAACWNTPAIQALLCGFYDQGITLPLYGNNRQGILSERKRALADPVVLALLIDAVKANISVRTLAVIVFGTTPGTASDDIGKAIDLYDPSVRKKRRAN